jgi:outer membrane protein assembly factor BamA
MLRTSGATLALVLTIAAAAVAFPGPQATPGAQATPEPPANPVEKIAEPTLDVIDVVRKLRHKPPPSEPKPGTDDYKTPMIAAAPVIGYNPANGFSLGLAGNIAFFRGDPATTRISSLVTSLTVTTKEQLNFNAKANVLTAGNRWNLVSDNRWYLTNQDTYGLGADTASDQAVNVKYDYLRFYQTAYRRVGPNLFAGAGFLYGGYRHMEPNPENPTGTPEAPYITYSNEFGFDLETQTSAGASVNALVDSRDSSINPSRGFYANLDYEMYFKDFLKGTSNWQRLQYDLRTYVRLTKDARHRLAFWFFGNLVTGGDAPYFDLPATGSDTYGRSGRGYTQGRFRGQRMVYGETEYRWTITRNGLLGMVAFLNTETLSNQQTGEKLFDSFATGAGVGLRLMLSKRSKTNLCVDFGRGKEGSSGVYFAVQEAF